MELAKIQLQDTFDCWPGARQLDNMERQRSSQDSAGGHPGRWMIWSVCDNIKTICFNHTWRRLCITLRRNKWSACPSCQLNCNGSSQVFYESHCLYGSVKWHLQFAVSGIDEDKRYTIDSLMTARALFLIPMLCLTLQPMHLSTSVTRYIWFSDTRSLRLLRRLLMVPAYCPWISFISWKPVVGVSGPLTILTAWQGDMKAHDSQAYSMMSVYWALR